MTPLLMARCLVMLIGVTLIPDGAAGQMRHFQAAGADGGGSWRSSEQDGVNSAALLLSCYGIKKTRDEVKGVFPSAVERPSLLDIRRALEALGLRSRIISCSPGSPMSDHVPAIALVESARTNTAGFVVVLSGTDRMISWIDAGVFTYHSSRTDDFSDHWTGCLLVGEQITIGEFERAAAACGCLVVIALCGNRFRANR